MFLPPQTATILITTKDRAELFSRALESALIQTVKCEIVIVDDASSDNTSQVARQLCPHAIILKNHSPVGIIAARNQGFEVATGDVVFTLDDDATFSGPGLVASVLAEFDKPYVGAVTIPLIDHLPDGTVRQRLPVEPQSDDFLCVPIFSGGANAILKQLFFDCGSYCGTFRQGEERGLSLKMLELGKIVRVASQYHIDHYPQARAGDRSRIIFWSARNFYQFGWRYVPFPTLISFLAVTSLRQVKNGIAKGCPLQPVAAAGCAVADAWKARASRSPVSNNSFRAFHELSRFSMLRLSELTAILDSHNVLLASS